MAGLESIELARLRHRASRSISENYATNDSNLMNPENTKLNHREMLLEMSKNKDVMVNETVNKCLKPTCIILQHVVSYPFIVLRRQCQLHYDSTCYHIVPFTLIPVAYRLMKIQGVAVLWKGFGTVLLIKGLTMAVEAFLSEFFDWPKEMSSITNSKSFGKHLLLKCVSLSLVTPFYTACLVETVQSIIASDKTAFYDVFKEGFFRFLQWNYPQKGRMLPIWILVIPTVLYGVLKYTSNIVISKCVKHSLVKYELYKVRQTNVTSNKNSFADGEQFEAISDLSASAISDAILYPIETIMHRLYLQGTRTIIDNLDTGYSVIPILTGYDGPIDCFVTTVTQEGRLGLIKGFGALILQTIVVGVLYKVIKISLVKIIDTYDSSNPSTSTTNNTHSIQHNVSEQFNVGPSTSRSVIRSTSFMM
ncbi:mitochondrial outer membrane protein SLC25A46-like [Daktulosphaira vitifoliae]|uniref:mitochondrial outer membrane protein SLC25A46-like n=1 Tax=Daktulosphaira vitifoliae TaxID=58002 RepID=UPI0021A9DD88|nr:mitochondrial outer membrane protein SLC25A46-like [Daktulosphaira vitifoliae]